MNKISLFTAISAFAFSALPLQFTQAHFEFRNLEIQCKEEHGTGRSTLKLTLQGRDNDCSGSTYRAHFRQKDVTFRKCDYPLNRNAREVELLFTDKPHPHATLQVLCTMKIDEKHKHGKAHPYVYGDCKFRKRGQTDRNYPTLSCHSKE